jgi:hypothetical protein
MQSITRAINMVRINGAWPLIKRWFSKKVEHAFVATFTWALSKRSIQRAIVDQFEKRSTPLCDALAHAVEQHMDDNRVEADDVHGLEGYINNAMDDYMRDFELDAEDIKGLDKAVEATVEEAVEEAIASSDFQENLTNSVAHVLARRLAIPN